MNWVIIAIVTLILITVVALYDKLQESLPRCPRCGARYIKPLPGNPVLGEDGVWMCFVCGWDGPEEDLFKR